jgi:hypothetical protein
MVLVLPALVCPSYASYYDADDGSGDAINLPGNDVVRGVDGGKQGIKTDGNLTRLV